MNIIPILIAEVFDVYRYGLQAVLNEYAHFTVADSVATGSELVDSFKKHPDAVCLVSSGLPDSNIHNLMKQLKTAHKNPRVMVFTHSTDLIHLNQSIKAGVLGYLTKNITVDELSDMILRVAGGEQAFSKAVTQTMIGKYADATKRSSAAARKGITKREREVLKLIVDGNTSAEIANKLYISTRTVETHRSNLMSKLEIKNTAALVRFALEQEGLI